MRNGAVAGMLGAVAAVSALAFWLAVPDGSVPEAPPAASPVASETEVASAPENPVSLAPAPEVPPGLAPETPDAPEPSPDAVVETEPKPAPPEPELAGAPEPAADAPAPPSIDVVRVDQDGRTVIAGRAPAGTQVDILLDGAVVGSAEADGSGSFAAFLEIGVSEDARALQLRIPLPPEAVWSPRDGWSAVRLGGDTPARIAAIEPGEVIRGAEGPRPALIQSRTGQPRLPAPGRAPGWSRAPRPPLEPEDRLTGIARLVPPAAAREAGRPGRQALGPLTTPRAAPELSVPEIREDEPVTEAVEVGALRRLRTDQPVFGVDERRPSSARPPADPQARAAPPIALWRPASPRNALRRSPQVSEEAVPVETLDRGAGVALLSPPAPGATGPVWRMPARGGVSDWPARHGRRLDPSARPGFGPPPSGPRFVPAIPRYGAAPERPHVLPGRPGTILRAMPEELLALLAAERPLPARLTEIDRVRGGAAPGAVPDGPGLPPAPRPGGDAEQLRLAALSPAAASVPRSFGASPALTFRRAPGFPQPPVSPGLGTRDRGTWAGLRQAALEPEPADPPSSTRATDPGLPPATGLRAPERGGPAALALGAGIGGAAIDAESRSPVAEPLYLLSAPVLILPVSGGEAAPLLVQPTPEAVALLQAPETSDATFLVDSLAHPQGGDVTARGRGQPGRAVRIYVNALYEGETRIGADGSWQFRMGAEAGQAARLLRFDELDGQGRVTARLEVPFSYSQDAAALRLTERAVEIQRGDHLWRLAEQHYGEGLRYALIFEANADLIRDPDLIYPGQVFRMPELVPERADQSAEAQ